MASHGVETEVKLAVADEAAMKRALKRLGFVARAVQRQRDTVLDTRDQALRKSGRLLRLRRESARRRTRWLLTFKGPATARTRYKERPEVETTVANGEALLVILAEMGYRQAFVYEKARTDYQSRRGVASLDRTPIGVFLELEGPPAWIDRTARDLGFRRDQYITASYGALYRDYCEQRGIRPSNMVFGE